MMKPADLVICQEIDELFKLDQKSLPLPRELVRRIRLAEAHIFECENCRKKYSTLATATDDVLNKK